MNERRFRQLNILTIIAVAVGIGMMLFFAFVVSDGGNQKISFRTPKKLDDTWVLYRQGESDEQIIDLPTKLKAKKGEIITITHQMPEDAGEDSAICFYTEFQNVIVSIGDRRVYESGVLADNKMTKNAVPGYHVVDIDARAGETVTIQLASAYGRYSGRIPGIYYGSRGDIVSWLIRRNGIPFVVSLMILVLTILLGVSLLFMTNENINKQKAAYGFGFIVFAAAWIFFGNTMMQLLTKNQFATYMASQIFLLLVPLLYFMYQIGRAHV